MEKVIVLIDNGNGLKINQELVCNSHYTGYRSPYQGGGKESPGGIFTTRIQTCKEKEKISPHERIVEIDGQEFFAWTATVYPRNIVEKIQEEKISKKTKK